MGANDTVVIKLWNGLSGSHSWMTKSIATNSCSAMDQVGGIASCRVDADHRHAA